MLFYVGIVGGVMVDAILVGEKGLYCTGITFIIFSAIALSKFTIVRLFYLMWPIYIVTLIIAGVSLIIASIGFYGGAKKFSTFPGSLAAALSVLLGIGYITMGSSLINLNALLLGIGLTIVKTALFFYGFATMYYFFEIKHGKFGGVGSILILLFSTSHHFFVFSAEFYKTLPGAIFTTIASIGYILQGISMRLSVSRPPHTRHAEHEEEKEEVPKRFPITRPF